MIEKGVQLLLMPIPSDIPSRALLAQHQIVPCRFLIPTTTLPAHNKEHLLLKLRELSLFSATGYVPIVISK